MIRSLRYIIVCFIITCCTVAARAQVLVKTTTDRDKILIGEPIRFTLEVHTPLGETINWFKLDTIPHFQFLDRGKLDTVENVDGKKLVQSMVITSFDSGQWQIPNLAMKAGNKMYYSDTVSITVAYIPFNPDDDYKDIKEIEEVASPSANNIPWFIAAGTLIALALIVYLLWSKKKKKPVEALPQYNPKLTPYEEAMQALEKLKKKGWEQNGEVKIFYTQLNDILRVFVLRKLNIASLEKTNEELITALRKVSMDTTHFSQLSDALRIADYVKFARYQPDASANEKNFTSIQSAITTLNNIT